MPKFQPQHYGGATFAAQRNSNAAVQLTLSNGIKNRFYIQTAWWQSR